MSKRFNLEEALADWRRQMAACGLKSPDVLDELESHLRDEIERQIQAGANAVEAYQAAAKRIGEAGALQAEFAKLTPNQVRSRFVGTCYVIFAGFVLLINAWTLLDYEVPPLDRGFGIGAVSLISLYLACLPYWLKSIPAAAYGRFAKVLKVASQLIWLWPLWALLEAEHVVHSGLGIVGTMMLWSSYAAVAMTAVAFGLVGCNRRSGDSGDSLPPGQPQPIPPLRPSPPDFSISLPPVQMFAPLARESLEAAAEEARRLGHDFIGTEHVLLGVLKLAKGAFEGLLHNLRLDRQTLQLEIERAVSPVPARAVSTTIPFTPRAGKALQLAAREAKRLDQPCVSAEHIFLGLVLEGNGVAGKVLGRLGVRSKRTRKEILSKLRLQPTDVSI